jgi:uncharacterized protein DUF5947
MRTCPARVIAYPKSVLRSLERYVRPQKTGPRCDLCGAALAEKHEHVIEIAARQLGCACRACAVLFRDAGAGGGRFRTVPDRVVPVGLDTDLTALGIPVRIAWVVRHGDEWIASFPSPAGPVDAALDAASWRKVEQSWRLEPDVEALLIHRRRDAGVECFIAPIDACFELSGIIRRTWKGWGGGDEVWPKVESFFAELRARGGQT